MHIFEWALCVSMFAVVLPFGPCTKIDFCMIASIGKAWTNCFYGCRVKTLISLPINLIRVSSRHCTIALQIHAWWISCAFARFRSGIFIVSIIILMSIDATFSRPAVAFSEKSTNMLRSKTLPFATSIFVYLNLSFWYLESSGLRDFSVEGAVPLPFTYHSLSGQSILTVVIATVITVLVSQWCSQIHFQCSLGD